MKHEMLTEAATFIRQAHELGMIAVVWMYPRGQAVADEKDPQLISGLLELQHVSVRISLRSTILAHSME